MTFCQRTLSLATFVTLAILWASPAAAVPVAAIAFVLDVAATSFIAIAATVVLNIGLSILAASLFAPKIKQQDRQASATTLQLGEQPRAAIFGRAASAGTLNDAFNYGGQYGTDWEVVIVSHADHRCHGLVGFYVSDQYVAYTTDGPVDGYNGQLEVYWLPGTETQVLPSVVTANGPGWTADDNLAGVAVTVVAYKADASDASAPIWTAGRPTFLFIIDGALCYDARKDSTVTGGSGTHRWSDPSTREWSDNPIVCRYTWVRGLYACDRIDQPDQLLIGRGLSAVEAPPENVAAYANICDEVVALAAGGTEKRYRAGGLVRADETYITIEEYFAASCAGIIIQPQGSVEIEPGHAKTPVATITDDDVISGSMVQHSKHRTEADTEWFNTVVPRYIEPTQKWADHAAPIRRVYADVIADGKPREETLSLTMVTDGIQAQRCGEIRRRFGRLRRTSTQTFGPRFAALEDGDWVLWTSARRTGGLPVAMRIESFGLDEKWQNTIQMREIASSVFAWTTADELVDGAVATQQPAPAALIAPGTGAWAAASEIFDPEGANVPAIEITGGIDNPYADAIVFEYAASTAMPADSDWVLSASAPPSTTRYTITGLMGDTDYWVAISYRVGGMSTPRLKIDPLHTPAAAGRITDESGDRIVSESGDQIVKE